jgi:hypothetical protein
MQNMLIKYDMLRIYFAFASLVWFRTILTASLMSLDPLLLDVNSFTLSVVIDCLIKDASVLLENEVSVRAYYSAIENGLINECNGFGGGAHQSAVTIDAVLAPV